jgi:hypothetical protein
MDRKEQAINKAIAEAGVFWAFGKSQLEAEMARRGLTQADLDDYVGILGGGACHKDKVLGLMSDINIAGVNFTREIKELGLRKAYILYELNNHEAFYTYDIHDTVRALGGDYTTEEVAEVFNDKINRDYEATN